MINYINENVDHHIITIEDPIEFYHEHKKSTVNQREVGVDVPSFAEAIRRALRQDPDVILVGEMRDLETIEAAITAAETGHVVFGTLHTTGAQGTVNRIIDVFPTNAAGTDPHAAFDVDHRHPVAGAAAARSAAAASPPTRCWWSRSAIANLIRENKTFRINSSIQTGAKYGMQLLDDHLFRLWKDGVVNKEECMVKSNQPDELQAPLPTRRAGHDRRRRRGRRKRQERADTDRRRR